MKRVALLLVLISLTFVMADISPKDAVDIVTGDIDNGVKNSDVYAEALGESLLKFQEFFMGALGFISLGFFDGEGEMDFVLFLFGILLFMVVYSIVGFMTKKFNFGIAFVITLLAMIGMDDMALENIFLNYEAMGIVITVVLPILILTSFTFRIYQRAYEGKSRTSPFYAEMFNLVFLIFFGVFFIRHSGTEEGVIAAMRFISGWILIGLGIGQTLLYKIGAELFHRWKRDSEKFKKDMKKMRRDAAEQILEAQTGMDEVS